MNRALRRTWSGTPGSNRRPWPWQGDAPSNLRNSLVLAWAHASAAFGRVCSLAPTPSPECLQDCGGIAGLAWDSAEVSPPLNLPLLRTNRRIGVRRRPVSVFTSGKFESRTPRQFKARDSLLDSGRDLGPPAFRVTDYHPDITALRRGKPEA